MQSFSTVCTSAVNTELCLLMVLLRKTHTCGEPRCIWLRPPARSSSQTSLWPLWRRVKCVSRRSLAMPTPWESVPLRCTPRKESGREYPALHPCVEHNTLLRSTSGEFSAPVLSCSLSGSGSIGPEAPCSFTAVQLEVLESLACDISLPAYPESSLPWSFTGKRQGRTAGERTTI